MVLRPTERKQVSPGLEHAQALGPHLRVICDIAIVPTAAHKRKFNGGRVANDRVGGVTSRCWHVAGNAATVAGMKRITLQQSEPDNDAISCSGYRFPADVTSYAVWLYNRFPMSLRMVEELLAARGIELTYETVRRWSVKFGLGIARRIRALRDPGGDSRFSRACIEQQERDPLARTRPALRFPCFEAVSPNRQSAPVDCAVPLRQGEKHRWQPRLHRQRGVDKPLKRCRSVRFESRYETPAFT